MQTVYLQFWFLNVLNAKITYLQIPFSHFFYAKKGFIHDVNMTTVPLNMVARLGLSIADAQDGPFKLEIDYIGLERQDMHKDITPYENYYFGPLSYV